MSNIIGNAIEAAIAQRIVPDKDRELRESMGKQIQKDFELEYKLRHLELMSKVKDIVKDLHADDPFRTEYIALIRVK